MEHPPGRIEGILNRFPTEKFLVLGDAMLDRYWWGDSVRLSPEAPVPVVSVQRFSAMPGGAANSAANLARLGTSVSLISVVGEDPESKELAALCQEFGICADLLVHQAGRPTTTKTRVIALHQHVVRVDHEAIAPVSDRSTELMRDAFLSRLPACDGVVISDYAKGTLSADLLQDVIRAGAEAKKPVLIDPKGRDHARYLGCSLLKPNRAELGLLTGMATDTHEHTMAAGRALSGLLGGTRVVVTEGAEGMTLFEHGEVAARQPALKLEVFDVTGAGDTVLAAMAAALCGGASSEEAMFIASHAAALTVSVLGTCAVRLQDLQRALSFP